MATTSGLSVSPGLGVSVIADRRSTVVGTPRQLQRERPWEEVKCTLGGGSWLKTLLGLPVVRARVRAFSRFGFPCSNPDPVVE